MKRRPRAGSALAPAAAASPVEPSVSGLRLIKWLAVLVLAVWLLQLFVSWLRGVLPWA